MEYIIGWVVVAVIAGCIGELKGNFINGFVLGLLLGPIGLLIACVLPRSPQNQALYEKRVRDAAAKL